MLLTASIEMVVNSGAKPVEQLEFDSIASSRKIARGQRDGSMMRVEQAICNCLQHELQLSFRHDSLEKTIVAWEREGRMSIRFWINGAPSRPEP